MDDQSKTTDGSPPLYGPDGRELPNSERLGAQDSGEWAEVGKQIERLVRRDVARLVGADEGAEWGSIKDAFVGRVRGQSEAVDTGEVGRRVEEVGRRVEEQLRSGMSQATGAGQDADWSTIAQTVRERVERAIDPGRLPFPGGSGTAADSEDAQVPAAPPTPDRPPTPAQAGGEDTGLPTVTEDVDEPPRSGNSGSPRPPV